MKSVIPFEAQSQFHEFLGFETEIEVKTDKNLTRLTIFEQAEILQKYSKIKDISGFYKSLFPKSRSRSPRLRWYTKSWNQTIYQFRNNKIVMIGDSLVRKVFDHLVLTYGCHQGESWNFLGLKELKNDCKRSLTDDLFVPRQFYCRRTNTSMYFMHHGQPFHLKDTPCQNCLIHISDLIDRMIEHKWFGEEYSIYATYGVHLSTFNPIVFARMLINVKNAVAKYKTFSPKSQFIFRTTTMMRGAVENTFGVVSGFNQDRFREITYRIFGDDENVRIFDPFVSVETLFDRMKTGDIHPKSNMIPAEAKYLTDFYAAGKNKL